MLLNVISFLLVFFQLFHSGGERLNAGIRKAAAHTVSAQEHRFRNYAAEQIPTELIALEESEDTEHGSFPVLSPVLTTHYSSKPTGFTPLAQKLLGHYRARAALEDQSLFLFHCNFRV